MAGKVKVPTRNSVSESLTCFLRLVKSLLKGGIDKGLSIKNFELLGLSIKSRWDLLEERMKLWKDKLEMEIALKHEKLEN